MDIERLIERMEDGKREFDAAMAQARTATDEAIAELEMSVKSSRVHQRYSRMYASRLQREIKQGVQANG